MASEVPASSRWRPRRVDLHLFLISFLILFFELACIRWFGSTVLFLTFFTNLVLLACFLGMSVGLLSAAPAAGLHERSSRWPSWPWPGAGDGLWPPRLGGDDDRRRRPEFAAAGLLRDRAFRRHDPSQFVVPIEAVAGLFFVLIALMFVGLGQVMGRAFDAIPDRVVAYTADILGSLAGIAAFGARLVAPDAARWSGTPSRRSSACASSRAGTWFQAGCARRPGRWLGFRGDRRRTVTVTDLVALLQDPLLTTKSAVFVTNNIGHQMTLGVGRRDRRRLHAAPPAQPRRRGPALRGRADHRRRLGQRRRGRAGRTGRSTSTPSRSSRSSTRSAAPTTRTGPTTTRGSRSTSTTAAASSAGPTRPTTWSPTPWSTRWCCTRAIRASGWRASCSPSRRSATSRRG